MAIWKEIPGYEERYLVSDEGEIYSLPKFVETTKSQHRKGKYLKPGKRGNEGHQYEFVILVDENGEKHRKAVHRLVALAFLENPDDLPEVNHIDENPLNNKVENLEWCDHQYNIDYSKSKAVEQYDDNGFVARYKSIAYASKVTGIKRSAINNALSGWSQTAGGYFWKYDKGENEK
jgi:hypothetical protein